MEIDAFLTRLAGVRTVGRGWIAQCPAHQDKSPSLSISLGTDMILVHCFAGCSFEAICAALDLNPSQFFFRESLATAWDEVSKKARSRWIDTRREAERTLQRVRSIDPNALSHKELDTAMNQVCDAHRLTELADAHEAMCVAAAEAEQMQRFLDARGRHGIDDAD